MKKTFDVSRPDAVSTSSSQAGTSRSTDAEGQRRGRADRARPRVAAARRRRHASSCAAGDRPELIVHVPARPKSWSLANLLGRQHLVPDPCPAGSDLKARTKSADVRARGTLGEVDIATASGDVVVSTRSASSRSRARAATCPPARSAGARRRTRLRATCRSSRSRGTVVANSVERRHRRSARPAPDVRANSVERRHDHRRRRDRRLGRGQLRLRRHLGSASAAARGSTSTARPSAETPPRARAGRRRAGRRRAVRRPEGPHRQRRHHDHPGVRAGQDRGGARMIRLSWDSTAPRRVRQSAASGAATVAHRGRGRAHPPDHGHDPPRLAVRSPLDASACRHCARPQTTRASAASEASIPSSAPSSGSSCSTETTPS